MKSTVLCKKMEHRRSPFSSLAVESLWTLRIIREGGNALYFRY